MRCRAIVAGLRIDGNAGRVSRLCSRLVSPTRAINRVRESGVSAAYLLDELEDVLHRALESFFVYSMGSDGQMTDDCSWVS